jgi:hypothetical protein
VRPRTLLVLLVLVVGLGLFIRFYEHDLPSSEERAQRAKKILDFKKEDVTAVTIEGNGTLVRVERVKPAAPPTGEAGGAVKTGGSAGAGSAGQARRPAGPAAAEWRLTRPLRARADAAAVDRLLDSLAAVEKTRTLDDVRPAAVGLDKPRGVVRLETREGPIVLKVGAQVPTGGELIAAVSGVKGAYVVSDGLWNEFLHKPGDWRDHHMLTTDRDAIQRIALAAGPAAAGGPGTAGPRVVLARRGDRFWIESPYADRADRDKVDKLLADLTGLTAERFADPPAQASPPAPAGSRAPSASASPASPAPGASTATQPSPSPAAGASTAVQPSPSPAAPSDRDLELGLTPPRAVLEVTLAGQARPLRVELGASHAEAAAPPSPAAGNPPSGAPPVPPSTLTWARTGGETFEARTSLAEAAAREPAGWRSPALSALEVHQVDAVTVRDGKGAVAFTRSGPDWKRGAATISYLPVSELLFALVESKADRFLPPAEAQAAGVAAGKPVLVFEIKSQAGNETISLYPPGPAAAAGAVPARVGGREPVLLLPAGKLEELAGKLAAARTAEPLPPPPSQPPAKNK